jgi:hypothetical protein
VFAAPDDDGSVTRDLRPAAVGVGCGVLLAWTRETSLARDTVGLARYTLTASFDGTAGDPVPHPSLAVASADRFGLVLLAVGPGGVGALAPDLPNACRFLPMDAAGQDRGPVQTVPDPQGWGCRSLAGGATSFSYLIVQGQNATPTTLVTLDATGVVIASQPLGDPPGRALLGRLARADGTFLLDSQPAVAATTTWLQEFDAQGNALSSPATLTANGPVLLAETQQGALASWEQVGEIDFQPVDRTGAVAGPAQVQPLTPTSGRVPFGEVLAPLPNGDVLVALEAADIESVTSPSLTFFVQERAPDGTSRGPLSPFPDPADPSTPNNILAVPSPDGARVLLAYVDHGIHTLPIACADP